MRSVKRQLRNEIQNYGIFLVIWNWDFTISKHMFHPMDRMCIQTVMWYRLHSPIESQKFYRSTVDVQRTCNGVSEVWNSINNIRPSLCPSYRTKQIIEKFWWVFENLCRQFMFHWNQARYCEIIMSPWMILMEEKGQSVTQLCCKVYICIL
jgi:hypothetical protein